MLFKLQHFRNKIVSLSLLSPRRGWATTAHLCCPWAPLGLPVTPWWRQKPLARWCNRRRKPCKVKWLWLLFLDLLTSYWPWTNHFLSTPCFHQLNMGREGGRAAGLKGRKAQATSLLTRTGGWPRQPKSMCLQLSPWDPVYTRTTQRHQPPVPEVWLAHTKILNRL